MTSPAPSQSPPLMATGSLPVCQCDRCQRQHDGRGQLLAWRCCVPMLQECGRSDCATLAQEPKVEGRRSKVQTSESKRCRSTALERPGRPVQSALPVDGMRGCPPDHDEDERSPLDPHPEEKISTGISEAAFTAGGHAASQDEKLIAFFSKPEHQGKMFPMVKLEEICGGRRMNNRAIALREYFKPLGFGLWNEMICFGPTNALHSHYGLFPLSVIADKTAEREEKKNHG
jgi:hypothetical protein